MKNVLVKAAMVLQTVIVFALVGMIATGAFTVLTTAIRLALGKEPNGLAQVLLDLVHSGQYW